MLARYEGRPQLYSDDQLNLGAIIFLFGRNICPTCYQGRILLDHSARKDIIIVVPDNYSQNDIYNLIDVFGIKGEVKISNSKVKRYYNRILSCNKKKDYKNILASIPTATS